MLMRESLLWCLVPGLPNSVIQRELADNTTSYISLSYLIGCKDSAIPLSNFTTRGGNAAALQLTSLRFVAPGFFHCLPMLKLCFLLLHQPSAPILLYCKLLTAIEAAISAFSPFCSL
ncbi:hypothetical protein BU25DRAFT_406362 [Macroventuria anomochaeta]|uniref:Uncharacterized protein n=1 Tax=Macroventuria anomochaeta TaxID=301207 RepID=A0ACB6SFU4_9PLEO|nr:uncharacterized protein BU25DRAFT_406362 [Macroventuria anomochaeta]KAF2633106.1 hypothetical protein BU25DRAFT_406362 [Macroventuria anomochaeta]